MKTIFFLFLIGITPVCYSQTCNQLPTSFNSYKEAVKRIETATFKISESVNTSKSSWIRSAHYYSCEGKLGYFIFTTDTNKYIRKDVPIEVWNRFKAATSFGSFYDTYIKYKYQLLPN
jgi:hypothetical protein